jgi:hypothetical protein
MAEQQSSILVGVFQDLAKAQQAYNDLRSAGFGDDHLGFANPTGDGKGTGKDLAEAGVPKEDSQYYEREFDIGHPLVTVRIGGLQQESIQKAIDILRQNGAYDANSGRNSSEGFASNVKTDAKTPFFDIAPGTRDAE